MAPAQTFHDHIAELRKRILWVVLAVGLSTGIGYVLRMHLINVLQGPLKEPLYYTSPAGSFNFIFKLATIVGIFTTLPVIIYQLMRFVEPALPIHVTKKLLVEVIGSSFALASAGIGFAYFYMIPMSLHFFAGYSSHQIRPLISANEYLSYTINILLTFALSFQIPLIILFINRIKPFKPTKLLHYQRHIIVGSFVFSIALPFTYDPISQFIVAIPIVGLYYFSIILLMIANRGRFPKTANNEVIATLPTETKNMLTYAKPANGVHYKRVHKPVSIDGFAYRPGKMSTPPVSQKNDSPVKENNKRDFSFKRPKLSIDGISQYYPTS